MLLLAAYIKNTNTSLSQTKVIGTEGLKIVITRIRSVPVINRTVEILIYLRTISSLFDNSTNDARRKRTESAKEDTETIICMLICEFLFPQVLYGYAHRFFL